MAINQYEDGSPPNVSRADVESYFKEFVFGFMQEDIAREVRLAESRQGAGNFLCALGLLVYTEAIGRIGLTSSSGRDNFNWMFDKMGDDYADWRRSREDPTTESVYTIFRNGMAHGYLTKRNCKVIMLGEAQPAIGRDPDGTYFIFVQAYFRDFMKACRTVYDDLMAQADPQIPSWG